VNRETSEKREKIIHAKNRGRIRVFRLFRAVRVAILMELMQDDADPKNAPSGVGESLYEYKTRHPVP
jgi:hypothetical protein